MARLDEWRKELAPSEELRTWFGHDSRRFESFRARYRAELLPHSEAIADLAVGAERGTVTLLYAARDAARNNAVVLRDLIEESLR